MRKLLLTLTAFISFSFMASAQFNKGSVLLGGDISYSSTEYLTTSGIPNTYYHSGSYAISIGKAIRENAVVGLNLSFSPNSNLDYSSGNGMDPTKTILNAYTAGIFYRAYKNLGKDFYLFGEAGANYIGVYRSTSNSGGITSSSSNGGSAYFTPGMSYKISKKFFLDLTIPNVFLFSYVSSNVPEPYSRQGHYLTVSTSLSSNPLANLAIGFRLNL